MSGYREVKQRVAKFDGAGGGVGVESLHVRLKVCDRCGAVVSDTAAHDAWHATTDGTEAP